MATKRKNTRNRTKTSKPRNLFITVMILFGRLIRWTSAWLFRHARKNPLLATGYGFFALGFGFITYNALFSQTSSHHGVFIETRPAKTIAVQYAQPSDDNQHMQAENINSEAQNPRNTRQNNMQGQLSLPENLRDAQIKLQELGLYDGPVDGLDGPKTQQAIAQWNKKFGKSNVPHKAIDDKPVDDIASLIDDGAIPEPVDQMTTRAVPKSNETQLTANQPLTTSNIEDQSKENNQPLDTADIMRVQAGLRAFGNNKVNVSGVEDATTSEALSQFQKMFSLSVTGKINREVIVKMREIGLLG